MASWQAREQGSIPSVGRDGKCPIMLACSSATANNPTYELAARELPFSIQNASGMSCERPVEICRTERFLLP